MPAVGWRTADLRLSGDPAVARAPLGRLRTAALIGFLAGLLLLAAAGSEAFRYGLLLRGRTQVLSNTVVTISDTLVEILGWLALAVPILFAAVALPALVATY